MKKSIALFMAALMLAFAAAPTAEAKSHSEGGLAGFLIGCCFGIRSAASYNDGQDLHWREWIRVIPLACVIGMVYDAVDGMNGVTTSELATRYGSSYY